MRPHSCAAMHDLSPSSTGWNVRFPACVWDGRLPERLYTGDFHNAKQP
ncbi:Hypothetical protein AA314_04930 [Archangium gephyra]|uniref:Uncharacterized protein n=1 Tax=Archangium gephyra TaxID=48 RepID=A0AAC8Q9D9_9BACT|nr:Hypothetical protein AA314_04930 [Archangium gephyra]